MINIIGTTYFNNPKRRCRHCEGREITEMLNKKVVNINLSSDDKGYFCKDKQECEQNIESENTEVKYSVNDEGNVTGICFNKNGLSLDLRKEEFER